MNTADLATRLEQELEEAFEVKSYVRIIAETMKQGLARTDRRFEDMNSR